MFYNCVMERDSLDVLCTEVASRMNAGGSAPYGTSGANAGDGYGGDAAAQAAAAEKHVGYLRARPSAKTVSHPRLIPTSSSHHPRVILVLT